MRMNWGSPFFVFLLILLLLGEAGKSYAVPIRYTFGGTALGFLDGEKFKDATFSITLESDTEKITEEAFGFLYTPSISSTIEIDGVETSSFLVEELQIYSYAQEDFFSGMVTYGVGFRSYFDRLDVAYQIGQKYGLPSGVEEIDATNAGLFLRNIETDKGLLSFNKIDNLTFFAVTGKKKIDDVSKAVEKVIVVDKTNPVPEPGTLLLLSAGVIGLAGAGRRKLKRKQ